MLTLIIYAHLAMLTWPCFPDRSPPHSQASSLSSTCGGEPPHGMRSRSGRLSVPSPASTSIRLATALTLRLSRHTCNLSSGMRTTLSHAAPAPSPPACLATALTPYLPYPQPLQWHAYHSADCGVCTLSATSMRGATSMCVPLFSRHPFHSTLLTAACAPRVRGTGRSASSDPPRSQAGCSSAQSLPSRHGGHRIHARCWYVWT
jgi:hypothetical protein